MIAGSVAGHASHGKVDVVPDVDWVLRERELHATHQGDEVIGDVRRRDTLGQRAVDSRALDRVLPYLRHVGDAGPEVGVRRLGVGEQVDQRVVAGQALSCGRPRRRVSSAVGNTRHYGLRPIAP